MEIESLVFGTNGLKYLAMDVRSSVPIRIAVNIH